jgi:glucokinase
LLKANLNSINLFIVGDCAHMAKLVLGIDLGGTDCKFGLMDETGHIVRKAKYPTRGELGPQGVLENMAENARKLMGDDVMRAVGLGVPGVMSSARGFVYEAPNLPGWVNVPVGAMLSQALGLSVAVNNDANAAAYGEFWAGAGRAVETMIMFTLGTGVGGGIILDGKLYTGPDDTAAELGHMCVKYDGPRCGCGAFGCLEALASATAVRRMVMEALAAGRSTRIEIPDNELELGAKAVADAAMAGDLLAREIFDTVGQALGAAVGTVINIFNPDMIVFGGAMANAGELIFDPVRREARAHSFAKPFSRVQIVRADLGEDAGIVGAAGLALKAERG